MGNSWIRNTDNLTNDKQACMYCKRADVGAGYMNTFSYCPDLQNR